MATLYDVQRDIIQVNALSARHEPILIQNNRAWPSLAPLNYRRQNRNVLSTKPRSSASLIASVSQAGFVS